MGGIPVDLGCQVEKEVWEREYLWTMLWKDCNVLGMCKFDYEKGIGLGIL